MRQRFITGISLPVVLKAFVSFGGQNTQLTPIIRQNLLLHWQTALGSNISDTIHYLYDSSKLTNLSVLQIPVPQNRHNNTHLLRWNYELCE